jgi:hypothetical protein
VLAGPGPGGLFQNLAVFGKFYAVPVPFKECNSQFPQGLAEALAGDKAPIRRPGDVLFLTGAEEVQ